MQFPFLWASQGVQYLETFYYWRRRGLWDFSCVPVDFIGRAVPVQQLLLLP